MRSFNVACIALLTVLTACAVSDDGEDTNNARIEPAGVDPQGGGSGPHGAPEPGESPMLGVHHARSSGPASTPPGNITWHGGAIMTDSVVRPIFWGASWANATFRGDKVDGLNRLYAGLATATGYVLSNTEYNGTNGYVGTAVTALPGITDTSAAPTRAPKTSAILAEVCKTITSPVANGYYPVYTDTKRGGAGYCAWHSYGTCSGVPVQFGFFFNLDGDSGCDPKDTQTSHSQGLAALASVSGHEWSETVTDPRNGGWWDSAGNENSDKCAWSFSPTLIDVTNADGSVEGWKIQGNWSNAAYNARTGYKNRDGQAGCMPL